MDDNVPNPGGSGDVQMVDNGHFPHGRVNPGVDESIALLKGVDVKQVDSGAVEWGGKLGGLSDRTISPPFSAEPPYATPTDRSQLLNLPSEIIGQIVSFLGPLDLITLQSTCRDLSIHARADTYWQRHVQSNVPGIAVNTPFPSTSFQDLYKSHDPHWFLPKYKLWFSDYYLTGKIIIARYDPRRGCIEGYRLVAERSQPTFDAWVYDEIVLIHSFEPRCRLHMDQPVLQISAQPCPPPAKLVSEYPMPINEHSRHGVRSNFFLTRHVEARSDMQLWPPPAIPSRQRVRNMSQECFKGISHKPQRRAEICETSFRIRRWMEMNGGRQAPGVHLGEEVDTYSTLDPHLYTPTADKPWRGLWVGDYSGHGCEFLLMHQPDNLVPFDESTIVQRDDETSEDFITRKKEERLYRGSIQAIKLTGDPNVPRGEYTFIADDISSEGYIRTANEEPFVGARVVRSRGRVATRVFRNGMTDKYIESELIMISPTRLAQHWIEFGHISFFERVNIDAFIAPGSR